MNEQNSTIEQAKVALKAGETILYPTDTIWGLGCDATNETAVQKIIDIKNRPTEKSFVLLVDGFQMIERYIPEFAEVCYELADFAEKPLTIIYPNAEKLAPSVIATDGSVGIRITKDPICLQLIRSLKAPIVSTSANLSGEHFPTCFDEIHPTIKEKVNCIVTERLQEKHATPSQIIKIGLDSSVKIIRS